MKKISAVVCIPLLLLMQSCQSKNETSDAPKADSVVKVTDNAVKVTDSVVTEKDIFSTMHFDNTKDFICGMPVSAGVADTANYKGKVYGFCATECKEEFLKDPESYLVKK